MLNRDTNSLDFYIKRRLLNRKYNSRPKELKILWIAKKVGMTYDQVRYRIKYLIKNNKIKKWTVSVGGNNPYRISRYIWIKKNTE